MVSTVSSVYKNKPASYSEDVSCTQFVIYLRWYFLGWYEQPPWSLTPCRCLPPDPASHLDGGCIIWDVVTSCNYITEKEGERSCSAENHQVYGCGSQEMACSNDEWFYVIRREWWGRLHIGAPSSVEIQQCRPNVQKNWRLLYEHGGRWRWGKLEVLLHVLNQL